MRKFNWARADWVTGLAVMLLMLAINFGTGVFTALDRWVFDKALLSLGKTPSSNILIAAIDDKSLVNIGRWPWSRDVHARGIDALAKAGAKTIVHTGLFFEPQTDHLDWVQSRLAEAAVGASKETQSTLNALNLLAERELDHDKTLSESISRAGNVILAARPSWHEVIANAPGNIFERAPLSFISDATHYNTGTRGLAMPIPLLAKSAVAVGAMAGITDADGNTRRAPLLVNYNGMTMPSLAFAAAAHASDQSWRSAPVTLGKGIQIGNNWIDSDEASVFSTMRYKHRGQAQIFDAVSFVDILHGRLDPARIAGRVVVIGATDGRITGLNSQTGDEKAFPAPVEIVAREISSLLQGHTTVNPKWSGIVVAALVLGLSLYLLMLLPRISGKNAIGVTTAICVVLVAAQYGALSGAGVWVPLTLPLVLLVVTHVALTSKRFLVTEADKRVADAQASESNREMAISLQSQGQLDAAYDRFRRVLFNNDLAANLRSLALDFERKRHFGKAQAVHEYILSGDPDDRFSRSEIVRLKALGSALFMPGRESPRPMVETSEGQRVANPTLGRYELTRELGRGSMACDEHAFYLEDLVRSGKIAEAEAHLAPLVAEAREAWIVLNPKLAMQAFAAIEVPLMALARLEYEWEESGAEPGTDIQSSILRLLEPAARPLGHWLRDVCTFAGCRNLGELSTALLRSGATYRSSAVSHERLKKWARSKEVAMPPGAVSAVLMAVPTSANRDILATRFGAARLLTFLCDLVRSSTVGAAPTWPEAQSQIRSRFAQAFQNQAALRSSRSTVHNV